MSAESQVPQRAAGEGRSAEGARDRRFRPMMELSLRLAGGPEAAPSARRALTGLERHLHEPLLEDVRLLVSELVTNSIRHGGAGPATQLELGATVLADAVRVEVRDTGDGFEPAPPAVPGDAEEGGFGLYLVEMIADRWGVERGDGTSVWFEISRNARLRRTAIAG
jgi:anti-sigma regulatory factor (Ser/Thr protein kinase)